MPVSLHKLCPRAEALAPDADLLARFAAGRDEAAFTELVRRHGPVVYRVCRRLAPASADDAFQAVFLILACRAGSVRTPAAVGSWLLGVAGRVTRQMSSAERRRVGHERAAGRPESQEPPPPELAELAAVLDDELTRLPDALRDPVVLCLIGGRTHAQAAAELGGSVRTVRRRLDRAKALLRTRLERRGVVPTVVAALVAGACGTAGAVPPALAREAASVAFRFLEGGAVASPAVAVAKGVMNGMATIKVSTLTATAAAVLVCLGVGWSGEQPRPVPLPPVPPSVAEPAAPVVPGGPPLADPEVVRPGAPPVGAVARGQNFIVYAPTPVMARALAAEAEHQRRALAEKWLGKELPRWSKPCAIRFAPGLGGNGGASTFTFDKDADGKPALKTAEIDLRGDFLTALNNTLPHEVTHAILAAHFGKPLPRWADEGAALLSETDDEQASHDTRARELLQQGRGVRLKVLLPMTEYPRDIAILYAQGHSVARFLVQQKTGVPVLKDIPNVGELFKTGGDDGHRRLLAFLHLGTRENTTESWGKAAQAVYGFASVDALEEEWLAWLATPGSVPAGKRGAGAAPPAPKPGASDLIPPVKLPGAPPVLPPPLPRP